MSKTTLYERLGGYDAICAVASICCPAYKGIRNWGASGCIGERMA